MLEKLFSFMFWVGFSLLMTGFILAMAGVHILNLQGASLLFASIMMISGIGILIITVLLTGVSAKFREPQPQWPPTPYKK